jgi:hypothetical protein
LGHSAAERARLDDQGALLRPFLGRCVLTHVREQAHVLARLAGHVRAGGVIAFGEPYVASPPWLTAPRPLLSACMAWVFETLRRAGARPDTGLALPEIFADAGLPSPHFRVDCLPTVGADRPWLANLARLVGSALPAMERYGVATAEQVAPGTLLDRLVEEGLTHGGTALPICHGSAWARLA